MAYNAKGKNLTLLYIGKQKLIYLQKFGGGEILTQTRSLIPATTKIKCSRISTPLVSPVGGTVGGSCRLPSGPTQLITADITSPRSRARDHEPEFQHGTPGSFFEETGKCKRRGENWRTGILSASAFAFEHFPYIFVDLILGKISILWFV